jgi:hypothetical protein
MPRLAIPVVLGLAGSFLVSGCSASYKCLSEALSAGEASVDAGSVVKISAPRAACDLGYGQDKTYELTLLCAEPSTRQQDPVCAPVDQDGSFSLFVTNPRDFPAGHATVLVPGSPLDDCGTEGSCTAYSASFTVQR